MVVVVGEIFMEGGDVGVSSGCMGVLCCCRYGVGGCRRFGDGCGDN